MSGDAVDVDAELWCELNEELDQLRVEKEADRQAIARLRAELQQADDARAAAVMANAELRAELERMRKVLEFVEHGGRLTAGYECPCCGAHGKSTGITHQYACDLGSALNRPECGETTDGT